MTGEPLKQRELPERYQGKTLCGQRVYRSSLVRKLVLEWNTIADKEVKNNMRNSLMSVEDKILLRKRALIGTVNDRLKNIAQIEHSRHRSFNSFIANALSAICCLLFFERSLPLMSILSRTGNLCWVLSYFLLFILNFPLIPFLVILILLTK